MKGARWGTAVSLTLLATYAAAQTVPSGRLAVLQAEDRRASSPRDLATLRTAARGLDAQTARLALRALGRLEQPALIADLIPGLSYRFPETRAEAANAIAQAAQGWARTGAARPHPGAHSPKTALAALAARLAVEEDPGARTAIAASIGRLPYRSREEVTEAEDALLRLFERSDGVPDRLGIAKGLEALVRGSRGVAAPDTRTLTALRQLASISGHPNGSPDREPGANPRAVPGADPLRDARVRRLAWEALISAQAIDDAAVAEAATDPDAQVRLLAVRAAAASGRSAGIVERALQDPVGTVRVGALQALRTLTGAGSCPAAVAGVRDDDTHVALQALDQLRACGHVPDAVAQLDAAVTDLAAAGSPRGWHRAAHALVALAAARPERAAALLAQFTGSRIWQLRMYAARAAALVGNEGVLRALAADPDDNVAEAAVAGLAEVAGHRADDAFIAALSRRGHQVVQAAARALEGTPDAPAAIRGLQAALQRASDENRAGSFDVRTSLAATLNGLGAPAPALERVRDVRQNEALTAANLVRLAAPRARITIRGVGAVDLALFTIEAPGTVLRFAQHAESGYYNGLTFHRVVPGALLQGGSPGASDRVGHPDAMRDEVGLWPHVRGAVGIATRGRDTGDARFFINLIDNPQFDHRLTVFAQVLSGVDVLDRVLEGDVIERIEIIP
jgi:cyclophilin family peptidyl-prolyl cis-trans isomerase